MLTTMRRKCGITLDFTELRTVLLDLPEAEWQPAILGQQRYFLRLAGVEGGIDLDSLTRPRTRVRRRSTEMVGDVFFRGDVVVYVVVGGPEGTFATDELGRLIRVAEPGPEGIEIGAMGANRDGVDAELNAFAAAFEQAVRRSLDGRRVRHLKFEWEEVGPAQARLARVTRADDEEGGPSFEPAALQPVQVEASRVMADRSLRELMLFIAEAVFVRQKEILERRGRKQEEIRELLKQLQGAGLITTEYLLECKRNGVRLSRFADPADVQEPKVGSLICASCGAQFREEGLYEGYSLSPLGRELLQKSQWMTVWISDLLVQVGVPEENIVWNLAEGGEEVDIIAEFLGQLWIFELKDREFGAGDAHPFNYRQVRYGADRAIIVSADRISRDAKRVFEDLAREDPLGRRAQIVYVEGLENAEATLRQEVSARAVSYARQRLSMLGETAGYDLGAVLRAKYNEG